MPYSLPTGSAKLVLLACALQGGVAVQEGIGVADESALIDTLANLRSNGVVETRSWRLNRASSAAATAAAPPHPPPPPPPPPPPLVRRSTLIEATAATAVVVSVVAFLIGRRCRCGGSIGGSRSAGRVPLAVQGDLPALEEPLDVNMQQQFIRTRMLWSGREPRGAGGEPAVDAHRVHSGGAGR